MKQFAILLRALSFNIEGRNPMLNQRQQGITLAIITGVCWALLAIALKNAKEFASTGTIAWFRMAFSMSCLGLWYFLRQPISTIKVLPRSPWVLVCGIGLAFNYFAYMRGLELTSAANAQIMIQIGPLALLVFGILYLKEYPSPRQWLGLVLATIGFLFFFWDQILIAVLDLSGYLIGNLWLLSGALSWALFAIIQRTLKGEWTPQQFNFVLYFICTLALAPLCTWSELKTWTLSNWFLMVVCGLNTLVAYGCFSEALKRIPSSHVSLIISANPLLTIFFVTLLSHFGWSWLVPEPIHWRGILGAFFVVTGVIFTIKKNRTT